MIRFKLIFWTALWLTVCMAPVLGHGDPPGRETEDSQRPESVRANDTTDPPQKDQPSPLTAPFDEATAKAAQAAWAKYLGPKDASPELHSAA